MVDDSPKTAVGPVVFNYLSGEAPVRAPFETGAGARATISYSCACLGALMEEQIAATMSVLHITPDETVLLLLSVGWNVDKALDLWTQDEGAARRALGISAGEDPPRALAEARAANIPLVDHIFLGDDFSPHDAEGLPCGHLFSRAAWTARFHHVLKNEPLCALSQKCLGAPACREAVRPRLWRACLDGESGDWAVFVRAMTRSFSASSRHVRACPAAGCDLVVEVRADVASGVKAVVCAAGHRFCFECMETPHEPASCKNASKWADRDMCEGLGAAWIIAHTKACPKCDSRIEKNNGCSHMTCAGRPKKGGQACAHEFCWQCLKP